MIFHVLEIGQVRISIFYLHFISAEKYNYAEMFPSQNYQLFVNLKQSIRVIFTDFSSTPRHTCLHRDLSFVCVPNGYLKCTVDYIYIYICISF